MMWRSATSCLPRPTARTSRFVICGKTIENSLHWTLDVAFREDESRVRTGHAAHNLAQLRRIALTLLQHESTARCGIKAKRLKAGWDHRYLLQVLAS
jgi:hypothetical protein